VILWLEKHLVLAIHDRILAEHGGSSGVRDEGLLESALARPQQLFAYADPPPDLADLAASLTFGIAKNHPFVDANKRTAIVSCMTFLALNGADLTAPMDERYVSILGLAEGTMSAEQFGAWLRRNLRVLPHAEVHELRRNYRKRKRP